MPTIFYSWQTDAPNNTNRGLIETALALVAKEKSAEINAADRPDDNEEMEIQQDTRGVPGTPDIAKVIFERIDNADVIVCDVTLSLNGQKARGGKRLSPNPNVLIELGYAIRNRSDKRVLLVFNTAYGKVEDLPFDLRGRRPVQYTCEPKSEKAPIRKALAKELRERIDEILAAAELEEAEEEVEPVSTLERAIDAIDNESRYIERRVREFLDELVGRLDECIVAPADHGRDRIAEAAEAGFKAAAPITHEWARLANEITEADEFDSLRPVVQMLETIGNLCWVARGHSGVVPAHRTEFFKLVGYHWVLILPALLIRRERWNLLSAYLTSTIALHRPEHGDPGPRPLTFFGEGSLHLHNLARERGRTSLRADYVKTAHDGDLGAVMPFDVIQDADLLFALWRPAAWGAPSTLVYSKESAPSLPLRMQSKSFAVEVGGVIGVPNTTELRHRFRIVQQQLAEWLSRVGGRLPLADIDPESIGRM